MLTIQSTLIILSRFLSLSQQKELQDKFFSLECENGNLKAHITHLGNALEKLSSTTENHFQELNISDKNLKDHINKNGILNSKILELQLKTKRND